MPLTEPTKLVLKKDSVAATDVNIREVSLLLHGNGANGSTTIVDSSLNPKTVTPVGNAQISTAQSKFGGSSIALDGAGAYLSVPTQTLSGDFTVELWAYLNNASDSMLISGLSTNSQIRVNDNTAGSIIVVSTTFPSIYVINTTPASFASLAWNHVALSRAGSNTRVFVNGFQVGATQTAFTQTFEVATIGAFRNANTFQGLSVNGFVDEVRISSIARYTSNFTPPTAPFPDF